MNNLGLSESSPFVSVVIPNYNGERFIERCLGSVLNTNYPSFEVILVDGASIDGSVKLAKELFGSDPRVKIFQNPKNTGLAEARNQGTRFAKGKFIAFLDNDTEVHPNWLKELIKVLDSDPSIGVAQAKVLASKDQNVIMSAGGFVNYFLVSECRGRGELDMGQYDNIYEIFFASGCAMIAREKVLKEIGLFDPDLFLWYEETDLCWRVWLDGYRVVYVPTSKVYHTGGGRTSKVQEPSKVWFIRRNQFMIMMKNYSLKNLITYGILSVFLYLGETLLWSVNSNTLWQAIAQTKAIIWNCMNFQTIWKKRLRVQQMRKISDRLLTMGVITKPRFSLHEFSTALRLPGDDVVRRRLSLLGD